MAQTTGLAAYDPATATLTRILVPYDDSAIGDMLRNVLPHEAVTRFSVLNVHPAGRSSKARAEEAVMLATGRYPASS